MQWHISRRRSFVRPCRFLFFALVFVLLAAGCWMRIAIADEWQPISPEELQMTSLPEAPGAPAAILYRQVGPHDTHRKAHQYNYIRVKILTEEGPTYSPLEIPYF